MEHQMRTEAAHHQRPTPASNTRDVTTLPPPYEESKRTRRRTSKAKKLDEESNANRMRKTHNKNVSKAQTLTDHHDKDAADHHDKNTLADPDKNNSEARILTKRDIKTKLKTIDKLSDETRLKTIYEKQNRDSASRSLPSSKTLLSQARPAQSDLKKEMYDFMKSTAELLQ